MRIQAIRSAAQPALSSRYQPRRGCVRPRSLPPTGIASSSTRSIMPFAPRAAALREELLRLQKSSIRQSNPILEAVGEAC